MRISPISYSFSSHNQTKPHKNVSNSPSFTSIFADARGETQNAYAFYTVMNPDFAKLKSSSTRIFREIPTQYSVSKLLPKDEKSQINVLGCSDGSEAWAYAIMMKEQMGDKAKENVKVKGVDLAPYTIEMAKTGRIICSDIEKMYANNTNGKSGNMSPLRGEGWDKYLIKSKRPEAFTEALKKYPFLMYAEIDPVARKSIGNGLEWYEINKEGLPEVTFEQGDMREHLKSNDDVQNEVYVIANAGAYLIEKNPDEYINLFREIKKQNEGKNKKVYVVTGDVENTAMSPVGLRLGLTVQGQNKVRREISNLGFEKFSEHKLRKKGVENYKDAASKIYVLKEG